MDYLDKFLNKMNENTTTPDKTSTVDEKDDLEQNVDNKALEEKEKKEEPIKKSIYGKDFEDFLEKNNCK